MIIDTLNNRLRQGFPGALLEVALIFVGITLAIAFENWNEERKERQVELALLRDLKSNLEENLEILDRMTEFNEGTVESMETILEHIGAGRPYADSLAAHLGLMDNWASPYLTSSAYETLRSRGLDIISDSALRQEIVKLFEVEYAKLVEDYDRSEWINYEVSSVPMMLAHLEETSALVAVPVDYPSLITDRQFRTAVSRTLSLRRQGIEDLAECTEATKEVISAIDASLDG